MERPINAIWPRLEARLPLADLGEFPTPVEDLTAVMTAAGTRGFPAWVKRDDLSSPVYGGNKVRTLEVLFGAALDSGASHVISTGAFGSNHAAATVLHAPRVGLVPGAVLFPQPVSETAADNLRVVATRAAELVTLPHWSALPFGMVRARRRIARDGGLAEVMVPGGATPRGALAYVSAALEVAQQVDRGELPRPKTVVVGVGSTCTTAGLLVGFHHAARMGLGFVDGRGAPAPPRVVAVRVTPWPVTSVSRILRLAIAVSRELAMLTEDRKLELSPDELRRNLEVDGAFLGSGYGHATTEGRRAINAFSDNPVPLDTTYSSKAAACFLDYARHQRGAPLLFWSTKSAAPLPTVDAAQLRGAPAPMRRWLAKLPK
ncbi:MAG: hypothetical protein DRJ42_26980 [Deltaproteobacteria bacterium]|nr:MAG: hypothetical protein DRJ42_26980 [Deltaproteobacteria bacterium]